jgi:hypothetical protein
MVRKLEYRIGLCTQLRGTDLKPILNLTTIGVYWKVQFAGIGFYEPKPLGRLIIKCYCRLILKPLSRGGEKRPAGSCVIALVALP